MRFTIALFALLLSGFASAQVSQIAVNAAPAPEGYDIRVDTISTDIGLLAGALGTTDMTGLACYRIYIVMLNEDDFLSSISGDAINPTYVNTSTSFYQAALGGLTASAVNSALFLFYPDLEYDSYVTIGLDGPADPTAGEANPSTVQSGDNAWGTNFDPSGGNISIDDAIGGAWYALNGDANGVAGPALEVLAGQFTTGGEISGQMYAQVFINGDGANEFRDTFNFGPQAAVPGCTDAAACNFNAEANEDDASCEYPVDVWGSANVDCAGDCISDLDGDGVCSEDDNCEDLSACNYDDAGNGACESLDECDVCGGSGIPAGDCDCAGNQLDVCGDCGGSGTDIDGDGLCDADDNCTDLAACNYDDAGNGACESLDECDVCGGSGIPAGDCDCDGNVLDECDVCGGSGIPDGDCDCDGNQLDACGVCDGDNSSCAGCIDETACDYDPSATVQAYGEVDGGGLSFSWTSVGSYASEISWEADGVTYAAGDEPTLDLAEGTYTITGYDSYGDGWNGGELVITDVASGTSVALAVTGSQGSVDITVTAGEAPALCEYESCAGCTDDTACNYDDTATIDEGCTYPQNDLVDCDNVCLDGGVFYEFSITDDYSDGMCCGYGEGYYLITAGGVEVGAGSDFGAGASHVFCAPADVCVQLTFVADNYPGEQSWSMSADGVEVGSGDGNDATYNYGTCVEGCMDDTACNFNADANIEGTCEYPIDIYGVANVDCAGDCLNDADDDGVCDEDEAAGCTDETACNAADYSDTDNSTCVYAEDLYDCNRDCDGVCNNDTDSDDVCDECEIDGCTDTEACNFDAGATDNDGSCEYPVDIYGAANLDCDGACLAGDTDGDGVCDDDELEGCQEEDACNYDASATDAGACDYPIDIYETDILDCEGDCLNDADGDGICDEDEDLDEVVDIVNGALGGTLDSSATILGDLIYGGIASGDLADALDGLGIGYGPESAEQSSVALVVSVDVSCSGISDVTSARMTGPWWGWDPNAGPEATDNGDGTWSAVLDPAPEANMEYLWVVNGVQENLIQSMVDGGTCAPITDYWSYANRLWEMGSADPADTFGQCDACDSDGPVSGCTDSGASNYNDAATVDNGSCQYDVTFSVDMSLYGGGYGTVNLNGSFNGWCGGCNAMTDVGNSVYELTLTLSQGTVEYKFTLDGWTNQEEFTPGTPCTSTIGGYTNRTLDVSATEVLSTVCYNECDACDTDGPVSGCTDSGASNYNDAATEDNGSCQYDVTFSVDMSSYSGGYGTVNLNGSFNGWCGECNAMTDMGNSVYELTLPLTQGTFEYKFTLDGWTNQEEFAEGTSCTSTMGGYTNRTLDVSGAEALATVCYNECDACASPCATIFLPTDAAWASAGYNLSVISAEVLGDLMAGHVFHDACDDLTHGDQITNWFGEVFQYADDSGMRSITSLASGDVYMIDAGPYTFDSESRLYTLESVIALASADPCLGCASLDITVGGAAIEDYTVECESDLDATGCSAAAANACNDLPLDAVACERFQFDGENQMEQGGGSSQVWDVLTAGDDANFNNGPDALLQFYDINGDMNQATFFVEDASAGGVILEQFENGTAIMSGAVVDAANPSRGLNIHLFFEGRTSGADWTGGFKNDYGCSVTTDLWTMYTMNDAMSYATGRGDWQFGTLIHFAHQPATQHFGYQLGDGANNHNCADDGFSGWFSWTGSLGGESATGFAGDVIAELDPRADYPSDCVDGEYVELHYIAFDDACSIAEHIVQRVTRDDNTAPTHVSGGDDVTLTCDESDAWLADNQAADETVIFTDNCDDSEYGCDAGFDSNTSGFADGNDNFVCVELIGQFTVQYTASSCRTLERRWVATDCHGNQSIHIQTIVIEDNTNPIAEVEAPGDIVLNVNGACYADFTPSNTGTAATGYSDNCDLAATGLDYADVIVDSTSTGCYSIIRTWTAMASDSCGNSHIVSDDQRIDIQDLIVPSFAGLGIDTIECDLWGDCSYDYLNSLGLMTVTDNCEMSHVDVDCTPLSAACTDDYVVDYTATDMCGNVNTFQQIVVTADRTAPVWSYAPADLTHQCSDAALDGTVTHDGTDYAVPVYTDGNGMAEAIDNCDPEITVTYSDEILPTDCDQEYTIKRTYSVPDCDENVAEHVQYITVEDTTAPEFTAFPADLDDVECDAVPAIADLGTLAAADNCDPAPSIVFVDEVRTDGESGLSFSWTSVGYYASEISWEVDGVTYAAGDEPTLDLAEGTYTINGYDSWGDGWNGGELVITDIASGTSVSLAVEGYSSSVEITVSAACVDMYTLARTWEAEDCAGNTHQRTQTIEVVDTTAPELAIECPGDILYSNVCHADGDLSLETNGIVTWEESDNCDADVDVSYTYADVTVYDCTADDSNDQGSFTVTRTFTVTAVDNCGNTTVMSCDQVLTFTDEESPVMTDDVTLLYPAAIACEDFNDPYDVSLMPLTATDNCDDSLTFTVVEAHLTSGSCPGTWIRHWVATDDCGNVSDQAIQYVATFDLTNPVTEIDCPSDVTLYQDEDCNVDLSTDANGYATYSATDNCDDNLTTWIDYEDSEHVYTCGGDDDNLEGSFTFTRTFTASATDECGNNHTVSCDQDLTVLDDLAPLLDVDCPPYQNLINVCFKDVDTTLAGLGSPQWTVSDNCDSDVNVSFTYVDVVTFQCSMIGVDDSPEGSYKLRRTFTTVAVDDCGNSTTVVCEQIINTFDLISPEPEINCPDAATVQLDENCETDSSPAVTGNPTATATDNCDTEVTITYDYSDSAPEQICGGDQSGSYTFIRTWTATAEDDCNNDASVSCDQLITVLDEIQPEPAIVCPDDATIYTDEDCLTDVSPESTNGYATGSATDNCDPNVTIEISYEDGQRTYDCSYDDNIAEGSYHFTRTWTSVATDDCGNTDSITCDQLITALDIITPVQDFPALTTDTLYLDMDCAVDMTPSVYPVATYSDNCDTDVENTVSYEDNPDNFSALFGEMGVSIEAVAEHTTGDLAGMTTYRVYATLAAEGDFLSSVSGEGAFSTQLRTTTSFYQHDQGGATPNTINALLYPIYPELEYDSWVTIGLENSPDLVAGEGSVNIAETGSDTWASTVFEGGGDIVINSSYGGAWYALNGDSNGLADEDGRVLVAQLTTDGSVNGQLFLQVFPQGDGSNQILRTVTFGDECAGDDSVTEGSFVTTRVWRSDISDDCGNSSTTYTYQNIVVLDTIAPQFTETCDISNGEQVEYTCGDDNENGTNDVLDFIQLPAACAPSFMENCDSEVALTMVSDSSGYVPTNSVANYCMPSTVELLANGESCDDRDAESIRLFNFAGGESFTIVDGGASLVEVMSGDSALHIVLETENAAGDAGFTFDAMYEGSFDWNAWLDQPGLHSYKKDCSELYPGIEIWTEWLYYVMANGTMEGTGRFAGSSFTLSHQPMNNYYGLQVGLGANNKNENYGASAWFFWSGEYVLDGASQGTVASSGDIFMDLDCCLGWQVNYEYTIVDDCGNSSGYGYSNVGTGEFGSGANSTVGGHVPTDISTGLGGFKEPIRITGLQPNPTNDYSTLGFVVSSDMRLRIDLYTMNGGFISELYDGNASADAQYILDVDASDLSSGMYQIRLSSNSYVLVKKLLVTE